MSKKKKVGEGGTEGEARRGKLTFERIKEALPSMPPTSRRLALYMLENGQTVAFSSTRDLGKRVGVSEASVVRFVQSLGFEGYIDFRHALEEDIKHKLGVADKIVLSDLDLLPDEKRLGRLSDNELENLKKTLDDLDRGSLRTMVDGVSKAGRLFLSGFGASTNMVRILEYGLLGLRWKEVVTLSGSISDFNARLCTFGPADALILITFPPYSREALHVAARVKKVGGALYLFTDSPRCPAYRDAAASIICANNSLLLTNSYVGLVAVLQIFTNMLALTNKKESAAGIREVVRGEREAYEAIARLKVKDNRWIDEEALPLD